jgi:hypothetical protein
MFTSCWFKNGLNSQIRQAIHEPKRKQMILNNQCNQEVVREMGRGLNATFKETYLGGLI